MNLDFDLRIPVSLTKTKKSVGDFIPGLNPGGADEATVGLGNWIAAAMNDNGRINFGTSVTTYADAAAAKAAGKKVGDVFITTTSGIMAVVLA